MKKQEILDQVKSLFDKNPDVNKAYVTSDGNLFRAAHYAGNWKQNLPDKTVQEFTRADIYGTAEIETDGGDDNTGATTGSATESGEKEKLADATKEFIELFDTKPAANLTAQDVLKQIADYKAERAKNDAGKKPAANVDPAKAERAALVAELFELTGKQATGLTVDKIKAKIAEAKAK